MMRAVLEMLTADFWRDIQLLTKAADWGGRCGRVMKTRKTTEEDETGREKSIC